MFGRLMFLAIVGMLAGCSESPPGEKAEAPAVGATKFNLRCTGETKTFPANSPATVSALADVLRFDLETRTWCREQCQETFEIERVEAGELVLGSYDDGAGDVGVTMTMRVNRVTGQYSSSVRSALINISTTAQCVREPFTGFPARQF